MNQKMEEAIRNASTIKEVYLCHRRAVKAGLCKETANSLRDSALEKLSSSDHQSSMTRAQQVMPGVWIGPFSVAKDSAQLQQLGITHIICLSAEGSCEMSGIQYLEHPLVEIDCTFEDGPQQLAQVLPSCIDFVRQALSSSTAQKAVLIHCLHGRTRSAAIAACIRAILRNEDISQSYETIREARDVYLPSDWLRQLGVEVENIRKTQNRLD